MLPVPLRRDRFTTDVGPDDSGSKPGIEGCNHLPESSGIDAALPLPPLAGPTVGATDCPKTGVAAAAASVTTKRKSRCTFMTTSRYAPLVLSPRWVIGILSQKRERYTASELGNGLHRRAG